MPWANVGEESWLRMTREIRRSWPPGTSSPCVVQSIQPTPQRAVALRGRSSARLTTIEVDQRTITEVIQLGTALEWANVAAGYTPDPEVITRAWRAMLTSPTT